MHACTYIANISTELSSKKGTTIIILILQLSVSAVRAGGHRKPFDPN